MNRWMMEEWGVSQPIKADWSADYLTCSHKLGFVEKAQLWGLQGTIVSSDNPHTKNGA